MSKEGRPIFDFQKKRQPFFFFECAVRPFLKKDRFFCALCTLSYDIFHLFTNFFAFYRFTSINEFDDDYITEYPDEGWMIYLHINENGEKEKCPANLTTTLSLSLGAAILLLGALAILFFKCYIVITDRREYARFIQERDNFKSAIIENPLHVSPITKFENPMYEKKQE